MSRYMEIPVAGPIEQVAERAHQAFAAIGKVEAFEPSSVVQGSLKISGYLVRLTVRWRPRGEKILLDMAADSDDPQSRAADASLYRFAQAYKDLGWGNETRFQDERREGWLIAGVVVGVATILGLVVALVH